MSEELIRTSKFLSFVLRHNPGDIGLALDEAGWADVDELIAKAGRARRRLSRALIEEVVATSDKQRFKLSDDGKRIRANQGHSTPVDLGLEPTAPPERLFHGTAAHNLEPIQREGLKPGSRQHVHLSPDAETAHRVGQRHGRPVILVVESAAMAGAGYTFFMSDNGVWLTDRVPPQFIKVPDGAGSGGRNG